MRTSIRLFLCSSLVVACGARGASDAEQAPGTPGVAAVPAATPGGGEPAATTPAAADPACTTPHRTFAVAPAEYYRVFASTSVALAALEAAQPKNTTPYLPAGNALEARGAAITARVFAAYQKLYPEAVVGMAAPLVVVADSDMVNGNVFAKVKWADGAAPSAPWLFRYYRGAFDKASDDQLTFLTAHELGHLLLRNPDPAIFPHLYYRERTTSDDIFFGPDLKSDPSVHAIADRVVEAGTRVGQLFAKELNGFGTRVGAKDFTEGAQTVPLYNRTLLYLHDTYARNTASPSSCIAARDERDQIRALVDQHYASMEGTLDFGADATTVDRLTKQFATDESTCLAHVRMSVQDAITAARAAEGADASDGFAFTQEEIDADASDPSGNVVTKTLALASRLQDSMRAFEADPNVDFASVRIFTQEDDADESGVRILEVLGIPVAGATGLAFLTHPDEGTACAALVAGGQIPPYAGVIDPHHAPCWRNYRDAKLAKALSTCAASWPE